MSEINILDLILDASFVVQAVMVLLATLAVIGFLLIFQLARRLSVAKSDDDDFVYKLQSNNNFNRLHQETKNRECNGLEQIFVIGYEAFARSLRAGAPPSLVGEAVERQFRVELGRQQLLIEKGLAMLASIGSVSPYIGLFGTVWGIMNAFIGLSSAESVSLATVAPGIAEALIATAIGLFAAIPASLGFNHFTAKANALYESRSLFCDELAGEFALLVQRKLNTQMGQ